KPALVLDQLPCRPDHASPVIAERLQGETGPSRRTPPGLAIARGGELNVDELIDAVKDGHRGDVAAGLCQWGQLHELRPLRIAPVRLEHQLLRAPAGAVPTFAAVDHPALPTADVERDIAAG